MSRTHKVPLLRFVVDALTMRGCDVIRASDPSRAPFYVVFETPSGERQGVLIYAFLANHRATKNRPADEHRFQIKYGGDLKTILQVNVDPHHLVTTVMLGIDTDKGIFVAIDPLLNSPSPMSRSVEFKSYHIAEVQEGDDGWLAWERERRPGKTTTRQSADIGDYRTETLIGGRQDRFVDLIALERIGRGLDPGERHLLADKLSKRAEHDPDQIHPLVEEFAIGPQALFDIIASASRLKMAVRGWVAEEHLRTQLKKVDGVTHLEVLDEDGKPDLSLTWKNRLPVLVECKNTLRTRYADNSPKVDFQKTRAAKNNPCSRYYKETDFQVLAACLHAVEDKWEFRYALTKELAEHKSCKGHLASNVRVAEPIFHREPSPVFDKLLATL